MKRITAAAAAMIAVLNLSGCTGDTLGPADGSGPAGQRPTASQSAPTTAAPEPTPRTEAEVKASAAVAGRPPAAFDIGCEVWEMPDASTAGQAWANKLGAEFLEFKDAECPDQVGRPYYFIDTFEPGEPGELVVSVDIEMDSQIWGPNGRMHALNQLAEGVMDGIMDENPDVEKVTAYIPGEKRYGSANRAETEKARDDQALR